MRRSSRDIQVGLFAAAAMAVLVIFLSVLGGLRIWKPSKVYHIRFEESVAGLDKGSPVRLKGVKVGSVEDLKIPRDDITKVQVTIAVAADTPIKKDTDATIASVGITGLRYIELSPGSVDAPDLPSGSTIVGTESFLSSMSATAETAVLKADVLIDNLLALTSDDNQEMIKRILRDLTEIVHGNSDQVASTIDETRRLAVSLRETTDELHTLMAENREGLRTVISNLDELTENSKPIFAYLGEEETLRKLDDLVSNTSELALRLNTLVGDNEYSLDQTIVDLRESSRNLNDFTRSIRARPSLLLRGNAIGPREIRN
jgi:phospholipid/cholesterol/gamma-HCH transport system substrate-binding protein